MSMRSKTALEHIESIYSAYCNNHNEDYLITRIFSMMFHRGLAYSDEGVKEMRFYIEEFEYSTVPSDPAFAHEMNRMIDWIESRMKEF